MGNSALRSHVGLKLAARPKRQREKERNWKNGPRIFLSSNKVPELSQGGDSKSDPETGKCVLRSWDWFIVTQLGRERLGSQFPS